MRHSPRVRHSRSGAPTKLERLASLLVGCWLVVGCWITGQETRLRGAMTPAWFKMKFGAFVVLKRFSIVYLFGGDFPFSGIQ